MQPDTQTGTINPVFAGYAAQQLQEATGGIDRVFDNLRKIARGDDPDAKRIRPPQGHQGPLRQRHGQKSPRTPHALRHTSRNAPRNQRNPIITRITVQTLPELPPSPRAPSPASKRSSTTHSALLRHPSGSTIPDMSPTLPATPPTSYARHSTTSSKSPTTEPSSPPSWPTYTNPTRTTPPSGLATASLPAR